MSVKGDKATTKGAEFVNALMPRLETLGEVTAKGMFGRRGIFQAGKMSALVTSDAELFLKVDESNIEPFTKAKSSRHGKMQSKRD